MLLSQLGSLQATASPTAKGRGVAMPVGGADEAPNNADDYLRGTTKKLVRVAQPTSPSNKGFAGQDMLSADADLPGNELSREQAMREQMRMINAHRK